jgi:PhnB protein
MPQLNAYLSFDGTCAEAMRFYADVLDAKLEALIRFADTPDAAQMPPGSEERVMHAYLVHEDFALMAGDAPAGHPFEGMRGVMLALTYPSASDARRVFDRLAQGGQVQMPLGETFWAEAFGMVTDRFGTAWGVNGGPKPMETGA